MKRLPIRWKFALWSAALVGGVVGIFAIAVFLNLYYEQLEEVDLEIQNVARHLELASPERLEGNDFDELTEFDPWINVAVFDSTGAVHHVMGKFPKPLLQTESAVGEIQTANAGEQRYRIMRTTQGSLSFLIAYSLEEAEDIVADIEVSFLSAFPLVLILSAFGGWWVSGRALGELHRLTVSAEQIRPDRPSLRLEVPQADDEIRRLVVVLNEMLNRLQAGLEQAQRFAADASHELRTPLTIIAGEVTRLLRTEGLPTVAESQLLSLQEEIGRLQHITEQMLLLAKFDANALTPEFESTDLSQLVAEACEDAELLATAKGIGITNRLAPEARVMGEAIHLRRLVLNLLQNAVTHNRPGGRVVCELTSDGSKVVLRVGNTGSPIPENAQKQLFERFYRSNSARVRGGHGLGLSLSREIVRRHQGVIELVSSKEDWTEFRVTLEQKR